MSDMATDEIQYGLTQEQRDLQAMIRDLATGEIAPRAAEIDATGEFPSDIAQLLASHDLLALPFDEQYGGTGTGTLMTVVAIEEIAKACASSALMTADTVAALDASPEVTVRVASA